MLRLFQIGFLHWLHINAQLLPHPAHSGGSDWSSTTA
jgi:hypothetical protein